MSSGTDLMKAGTRKERIMKRGLNADAKYVSLYMPDDMHAALVERAKKDDRTLAATIRMAIRDSLGPDYA